ncbi:MAG: alpha/beta hydrolase [Rhodospirillales bacterium]
MLAEQQQAAAPRVHELEERIERSATLHRTPCGEGHIAWHGWGAADGNQRGTAIFLLHGGFGSWKHWLRNIDGLAQHHRVFAADLPGLGSSPTAPEPHTAPALAQYFAQGIRQLDPGDAPVLLAGFSLGSSIAAHTTVSLGDKAKALVVLGASGMGAMWQNKTHELTKLSRSMSLDQVRGIVRGNLALSMIYDPAKIDDQAIDVQRKLLAQKRSLLGMPISTSETMFDALDNVSAKTTMLFGEHDCYMSPSVPACLQAMQQRYPALRTRMIEGAGHWVMYEEPEAVNKVLLDALGSAS